MNILHHRSRGRGAEGTHILLGAFAQLDVLDMAGMQRPIETQVADVGRRRQLAAAACRLLMRRHGWRQNAERIVEDAGLARSDA